MNEARSSGPVIDRDAAAALIEPLTGLVVRAGTAILAVDRLAMKVDGKPDGSPVTEADLAADRIIGEGLARLFPDVPALSEERAHLAKPPYEGSFFLIDPLDGTKEFVAGRSEFTVNLALVTNGTPLLGIIGAPALGLVWRGLVGRGAERLTAAQKSVAEPIHTRTLPQRGDPWIAAVSRSHADIRTEAFIAARPGAIRQVLGSAVKFGRLAEGAADIPASRRPANGMSRQDTPSSPPRAERSRMRKAVTCNSAKPAKASSCRNSSPGVIPRRCFSGESVTAGRIGDANPEFRDSRCAIAHLRSCPLDHPGMTACNSLHQTLLQRRPAQFCLPQEALRSGGERIPVFLAAEQIKPLPRDQPEPRVAGESDPPRQVDRVVAPELGPINMRIGDKRSAIALIAETPDRAGFGSLEVRQTDEGVGVDEVSDRVETLDRDT